MKDLQSASSKAIATMSTACKTEVPATTKAELQMMDTRLETMSQAVTLRPAGGAANRGSSATRLPARCLPGAVHRI